MTNLANAYGKNIETPEKFATFNRGTAYGEIVERI